MSDFKYANSDRVFDTQAFVEEVERYRVRRRMSQVEMADTCGVGRATYKRMIKGTRSPGLRLVCLLANECDLSLDKFRIDVAR